MHRVCPGQRRPVFPEVFVRFLPSVVFFLCATVFALGAHAGPNFEGIIQSIDKDGVTLRANAGVPLWVKAGQTVSVLGWQAQVREIRASQVVLALDAGKLKRANVGDPVSIREPASEEPQMCGS